MTELDELMSDWKQGEYINPDALIAAYNAVSILVEKVKLLEDEVNTLKTQLGQ